MFRGISLRRLGLGRFAGRVLTDADDTPGAAPAVVMSYQAWQSRLWRRPECGGIDFLSAGSADDDRGDCSAWIFFWRPDTERSPALWIPLSVEPTVEGKNSILRCRRVTGCTAIGR